MKTKKNFTEICSCAAVQQVTNRQALNNTAKGAREDLRERSNMYYVNVLNRMARKNEYMDNVNMRDLQRMYCAVSGEREFTLRMFTPDYMGRPCVIAKYKGERTAAELGHGDIVTDKGNELRASATDPETIVMYRAISKSESGFVSAFRAVLAPFAAEQDKEQREREKAERKAERAAESQAKRAKREAIKAQQQQARADYNNGKIDMAEFAAIMAKTA